MDRIDLNTRDRRNLFAEGADNVIALETSTGEIAESDADGPLIDALQEAYDQIAASGQRFAYVVIKVVA